MVIHVRDGEPLFKVIKRFTKEVQRAGILTDLREHRHFVTAGQKRKRKRRVLTPPGPGRNLAIRPGGGPHAEESEKRARDKLRREVEEQREDPGREC